MTADRPAWFQGEPLHVHVNAEAAALLRDAFDRIARLDPTAPAAAIGLELRLYDGRPVRLSVRLTDAGEIRDADDAQWRRTVSRTSTWRATSRPMSPPGACWMP
ncbi:MAG TPA: hypothetical protein VK923_15185 [Euzebyales bacterium]|nr:hypothetical protein [Euzebyales bacterium]